MIWIVWLFEYYYAHINSVGSHCYFHLRGLSVLCGGLTSKIEVLVPSVAQIMKEGSSAWVTSLFLTPHAVVIRSAYSCFSSKQINIYYSHSSVQLRGFMTPPDCAALPHKGTLWDGSIFGDHYLHSSARMTQRRVTEESFGDTAADINKQ